MTNGTFGEAATLSQDELEKFVAEVLREAGGAVPVFAGATGLFLGRPMWSQCDDATTD